MMKLIPVLKRQLTRYINARPRVQKVAQRRIAHLLRQWLTQLRLRCIFQQLLNFTYVNLDAVADLSDYLPASYLKRNISLIFRIVLLQFAMPSSLKWASIASCFENVGKDPEFAVLFSLRTGVHFEQECAPVRVV